MGWWATTVMNGWPPVGRACGDGSNAGRIRGAEGCFNVGPDDMGAPQDGSLPIGPIGVQTVHARMGHH